MCCTEATFEPGLDILCRNCEIDAGSGEFADNNDKDINGTDETDGTQVSADAGIEKRCDVQTQGGLSPRTSKPQDWVKPQDLINQTRPLSLGMSIESV